jgi:hypothetical protein
MVGSIGYGVGVRSSSEALPERGWVASDPHLLCEVVLGRVLTATWTVVGTADTWPTSLPERAECRNGALSVPFRLAFRAGDRRAFLATDGALVVPHDGVSELSLTWSVAEPVVSAAAGGPDRGVECGVSAHGEWTLQVGAGAPAGASTCKMRLQSGAVLRHEVRVVRTVP